MFILRMFPLFSDCFRFNYYSQVHAFFSEKDYTSPFFAGWLPMSSHPQSLLLPALLELARWFALTNGVWLDEMYTPVCADALNVLSWTGLASGTSAFCPENRMLQLGAVPSVLKWEDNVEQGWALLCGVQWSQASLQAMCCFREK